ncbi:hypothetical protein [Candidatus Liberibacter sp.]|uniref:hypothetical protein n=1 Tax=Candidatus Liberibacter sp. TaxID=34022 RepID=UPI001C70C89F|nr:hypothetical protein [Candidatus Liberibacter sp.]
MKKLPRRIKAKFGYTPDLPDIRDFSYIPHESLVCKLPPVVDLTSSCPPVYNQGQIGSCTANALAGSIQYERLAHRAIPDFIPSRLFIYYNERLIEGHVNHDSGATLRDGIKTLHKIGVCSENTWPYDGTMAKVDGEFPKGSLARKKPSASCLL